MVQTLRARKYNDGEIWDLLFGIGVGLCADINRAVGITETSDISTPMLNSVLMMISGYLSITKDILDPRGDKPFTPNLGFTNYASMAPQTWRDSKLICFGESGWDCCGSRDIRRGEEDAYVADKTCERGDKKLC
jgi:hypothetical protein